MGKRVEEWPARASAARFNGRRYRVLYAGAIYGMTDRVDDGPGTEAYTGEDLCMTLTEGSSLKEFHAALHEALEASGLPDGALHGRDGEPTTYDAARFLWRTWVRPGRAAATRRERP